MEHCKFFISEKCRCKAKQREVFGIIPDSIKRKGMKYSKMCKKCEYRQEHDSSRTKPSDNQQSEFLYRAEGKVEELRLF